MWLESSITEDDLTKTVHCSAGISVDNESIRSLQYVTHEDVMILFFVCGAAEEMTAYCNVGVYRYAANNWLMGHLTFLIQIYKHTKCFCHIVYKTRPILIKF